MDDVKADTIQFKARPGIPFGSALFQLVGTIALIRLQVEGASSEALGKGVRSSLPELSVALKDLRRLSIGGVGRCSRAGIERNHSSSFWRFDQDPVGSLLSKVHPATLQMAKSFAAIVVPIRSSHQCIRCIGLADLSGT